MRAFLASSIGVVCATALVIPLTALAGAAPASAPAAAPAGAELPGSTQSLPLTPLGSTSDRAAPESAAGAAGAAGAASQGLAARDVRPFSLVGVVWRDPGKELHGQVQVRTRSSATGRWSAWQQLQAHSDDAPDMGSPEWRGGRMRGGTAPLWVGASDGVQVRVSPQRAAGPLPAGLRLELVDPGGEPAADPAGGTGRAATAGSAPAIAGSAPATGPAGATDPRAAEAQADDTRVLDPEPDAIFGDVPALPPDDSAGSGQDPAPDKDQGTEGAAEPEIDPSHILPEEPAERTSARPFAAPRPRIITRAGWRADESLRERGYVYTKRVRAAFIHHSATGNGYACSQAPAMLRGIYRYHVKSSGWRDFGYNFAVDKCGNIYEGRAGGVTKAVMGAHTMGFNSNTMGIAVLGTYTSTAPSKAAVAAIAKLTAWKLGLFGANPQGTTTLVSGGSNKYRKGARVQLKVISGHRDGFVTECPGAALYARLGSARSTASDLQGR
ncbi:N-acetylmuramoyl-L-alanine amidase [Streptomyces sp. P1-3]|uniref:peptidoglycan recognition protein family protein n=1 Tax=Streptomyces sp. P1-3 TaxID=3421658 RepID=UPI003D365510